MMRALVGRSPLLAALPLGGSDGTTCARGTEYAYGVRGGIVNTVEPMRG